MHRESGASQPVHQDEGRANVGRRRSLGIYYTPQSAAQVLAGWAIRGAKDTVLEPSFGGCAMLEAAVARLRALGCREPAAQLQGFDVDEGAFAYLRRLLGGLDRHPQFALGDFLMANPGAPGRVTAVLANPPFVSYHRMNAEQRRVVRVWREQYSPDFPMTASLWAYFLIHALSFLSPSGRLAFVLPASAITADYGKPIIEHLTRRFARVYLFRVGEPLFIQAGAKERTVLLLSDGYQITDLPSQAAVECTVSSLRDLEGAIESLSTDRGVRCNVVPTWHNGISLLDSLRDRGHLCTFGEVVRVTIGEVVGDTEFFVKTIDAWEALGIGQHYLKPIVTRMRQFAGVRMNSRDVASVYSRIPRLLVAPLSRLPKKVQQYLKTYPRDARHANSTFAKRAPWYAVSYDPNARAFIGSLSQDAPRVVLNSAHASCANGLYKLLPARGVPWRSALTAAALSTVTQLSAEVRARTRGGGALKLEPSDVRGLLLPTRYQQLSAEDAKRLVDRVDNLVRGGEREAAVRLVDEVLLVSGGIVTPAQLRELRHSLCELRQLRLRSG